MNQQYLGLMLISTTSSGLGPQLILIGFWNDVQKKKKTDRLFLLAFISSIFLMGSQLFGL